MNETVRPPIALPRIVPTPPQGAVPPDKDRGEDGKKVAVASRRPPGEVDHRSEHAGQPGADTCEDEGLHSNALNVDPHLLGRVGIVADDVGVDPEAVSIVEKALKMMKTSAHTICIGIPNSSPESTLRAKLPLTAEGWS